MSNRTPYFFALACTAWLFLAFSSARAQDHILKGTVFDSSRSYPLEAVSVLSTSGRGTITNREGHYELAVSAGDSVWFSYLNKPTMKFPVRKITDFEQFDIALQVNIPVLKEVTVTPRNYRLDSIRNRIEYEKIFNFHRPTIGTLTNIGPTGAGIDIDELIRTFQFRKNRNMQRFQERLLQQERDKFIDHRFNRGLVHRLTGLDGEELDSFMVQYRPPYEIVLYTSDYDFQTYIKASFARYQALKSRRPEDPLENP
ncbi:MAG TPA: hypothetical protein VG870_14000 [Chitinophagaceae bacterium]|nr:hypothetical protein [Chitinophagaceae bacterium]